jgi:DNA-3-methyladenine glycosylase
VGKADWSPSRIERFFSRPSLQVAADLLGSRVIGGGVVVELTEVEAYAGEADPASHAFRGPTPRNTVMYGAGGRVYVYFSYGMHNCVNLVCDHPGTASAVLLRAGRVVSGSDEARARRGEVAEVALARGPGNLAKALGVTVADTGTTVWDGPLRWRARTASAPRPFRTGPRVGVSQAADVAWRLWLDGEPSVSTYRRHPKAAPPPEQR